MAQQHIANTKLAAFLILTIIVITGCRLRESESKMPVQVSFGDMQCLQNDSGIDFNHRSIKLHIDEQMHVTIQHDNGETVQSIVQPGNTHTLLLNGETETDFLLDKNQVQCEQITGQFGEGLRLTLVGLVESEDSLERQLTLELYEAYPNSVLTQASYRNLGGEELTFDAAWHNKLTLDRQLVAPSEPSYAFKMVSMGDSWGNALRDRIWSLAPGSSFANYNGGDSSNHEDFNKPWGGGGTPITTVWGPETAVTIAVVEPTLQIVGVPVTVEENGRVLLGVKETNDLPQLAPGSTFTGVQSSITVHSGDFYDGVAAYGQMLHQLGVLVPQYTDVDYEAHWDSFGLEEHAGGANPGDWQAVNPRLYIPKDLGLTYINIDSGWDDGTGSCTPYSRLYKSEEQFVEWIGSLHEQGFKVSLWIDPGFDGGAIRAAHPDWFIQNEDGSYFQDDWGRYVMDPTVPEALEHVGNCITKIVTPQSEGGWGINRLFLDGVFLVPPDYSGRHESPHETEKAGDGFYRVTFEAARAIDPNFPIEFCPCGGVVTVWLAKYFTMNSTSDPDVMELRPHEVRTKLYKALFGAHAPINGDHIEGPGITVDMNYVFPLVLGVGDVYQTYYWGLDWRDEDPLGIGVRDLYVKWFDLYDELRLSQGEYLNLYDLAYDEPGSHAIAKGDSIFYLFAPAYDESFSGEIELRGLDMDVDYEVVDYENDISWGKFSGPIIKLNVEIPQNDPLLLKASPAP